MEKWETASNRLLTRRYVKNQRQFGYRYYDYEVHQCRLVGGVLFGGHKCLSNGR